MSKPARVVLLALCLAFLPACSVYIGAPMSWKTRKIPKPEGALVPAISTASESPHSSDRNRSLATIAGNPKLTAEEQKYVLAIVSRLGGFSSDTSDVLVELAKNPASTHQTREEISDLVPELSLFSSDVSRVSEALAAER